MAYPLALVLKQPKFGAILVALALAPAGLDTAVGALPPGADEAAATAVLVANLLILPVTVLIPPGMSQGSTQGLPPTRTHLPAQDTTQCPPPFSVAGP